MLGDFITRILVLILGYAYPAFECFKTVEKNRVEIEELRFWCQYWILVAVVTVFERICDIFVSWVPMYGEMKLGLFIYLWYPKTKGTGYVYDSLFKPYMAKHETDIDRNLQEFRARAWDLLIYYCQNCTQLGQTAFFQILEYVGSQIGKMRQLPLERAQAENMKETSPPPPRTPPSGGIFRRQRQRSDRRRPPTPPPLPTSAYRSAVQSPKSDSVQVHLDAETQAVRTEEVPVEKTNNVPTPIQDSDEHLNQNLHTRLKLRRSKGFH